MFLGVGIFWLGSDWDILDILGLNIIQDDYGATLLLILLLFLTRRFGSERVCPLAVCSD